MSMGFLILICGSILIAACVLGFIGLLVYHFMQKDQADR